ncbi:hypothetical protein D3C72_1727410 [compost metagenome]
MPMPTRLAMAEPISIRLRVDESPSLGRPNSMKRVPSAALHQPLVVSTRMTSPARVVAAEVAVSAWRVAAVEVAASAARVTVAVVVGM